MLLAVSGSPKTKLIHKQTFTILDCCETNPTCRGFVDQRDPQRRSTATVIRSVTNHVNADLLVIGTLCLNGAAGLPIGNTAETVLSDVNGSMLALKPAGFI